MDAVGRGVRARSQVDRLAITDPNAALKLASSIDHSWYRCQSLVAVAEQLHGKAQTDALSAALAAAREQFEPNRVVTVASWPVRILARIDPDAAAQQLTELVAIAATEPHNLRRAHALQRLAFVVSQYPSLLRLVVPALSEALLGGYGSRIDRVIRDTFNVVRLTHPELLRPLALHHKSNQQQQKLLALLSGVEI